MPRKGPFDFSSAMWRLCDDVTRRVPELEHIDMTRVAVSFAQTRTRALHGLQAKLTPMRFENGALTTWRRGIEWTIQRVYLGDREMLYLLTFYLPRFLDQPFHEKLVTVFHELYHIGPRFDGDLRRWEGRYHVHSHSQREYDRRMARLADAYLARRPPRSLYAFLQKNFRQLRHEYGEVVGLRIPIPKLIPVRKART
ncbi:MAG: hypothetical protein D6725_17465, partial [Planctomycetota bacterium]